MREVCRVLLDKVAIPDGQNFREKTASTSRYQSKFSVSSVKGSPVVVANSVDAEVTRVLIFPVQISKTAGTG